MKILLIEDDPDIRDIVNEILEFSGYEVIVARDGVEGVERLSQNPDLILSDIGMPRMDGLELLSIVRGHPEFASLPFLFLTAQTDPAFLRKARALGADECLPKPFTSKQILSAIEGRLHNFI